MSEPTTSEMQDVAVFSTIDKPTPYNANNGYTKSRGSPASSTVGFLIQSRGVEEHAINASATKVGLILSPKYYVIRCYPYKQKMLEQRYVTKGIIAKYGEVGILPAGVKPAS